MTTKIFNNYLIKIDKKSHFFQKRAFNNLKLIFLEFKLVYLSSMEFIAIG
jgi:hypothetical protein